MERKAHTFLGWYLFVLLGGVFALVSNFLIEMPYNRWLANHLPIWLGIVNVFVFCVCFVSTALSVRPSVLKTISVVGLVTASIIRVSFTKAPLINAVAILLAVILFVGLKRSKRKRSSIEGTGPTLSV